MRALSLVVLFAACTSSSQSGDDTVETISMSCSTGVTDYCKTNACDQSLADAVKDTALCPASQISCGGFTVILRTEAGTVTTLYYQGDSLVAIAHPSLPGGPACLAGPASFSAQRCAGAGKNLTVCGSGDPPSGW